MECVQTGAPDQTSREAIGDARLLGHQAPRAQEGGNAGKISQDLARFQPRTCSLMQVKNENTHQHLAAYTAAVTVRRDAYELLQPGLALQLPGHF